jgi:branched-chain amino acid transport system ATP-binding protein
MSTPILSIEGLVARYGQIEALRDATLHVAADEAVALLGANGAGKSTVMKSIMGFLKPASGRVLFQGNDLAATPTFRRSRLGIAYCPEGRRVFPGMTVRENLEVAASDGRAGLAARVAAIYDMFPALAQREAALGWQLSGGQQQMLAIGRALMSRPRLLLLDEPSLGLSPLLTNEVLDRVRVIVGGGTAILLAEQNVGKALSVCDRAYVLQVGRIVKEGRARDIAQSADVKAAFLGS